MRTSLASQPGAPHLELRLQLRGVLSHLLREKLGVRVGQVEVLLLEARHLEKYEKQATGQRELWLDLTRTTHETIAKTAVKGLTSV